MQKTVFAIALALTLSVAIAGYTAENFVKPPLSVCADSDTNFTNQSALTLGSLGLTDLNLISANGKVDPQNTSSISFTLWTRKLDAKALGQGANKTYTFTSSTVDIDYVDGYVFFITAANDTANIPQLFVSQIKLDGNTQLPRFVITTNTNSSFKPTAVTPYVTGKNVYIYYIAAFRQVNVTSFTAGGSAMGKVFNVTTNYDGNLAVTTGNALSSGQTLAIWNEGDALKEAIVDGNKATVTLTANPVGGYTKATQSCYPYVTDKKLYGTICKSSVNGTQTVFARTNSSSLSTLYTANLNETTEVSHFPYSGFWTFVYQVNQAADVNVLSYETWDLEKFVTTKNRTKFLTINPNNSTQEIYRIPGAGVYVLLYNNKAQDNATLTGVQAGLLLGSSYLTSVFGFLLAIVAGLFLF